MCCLWDPGDGSPHPHRGGQLCRLLSGAEEAGGRGAEGRGPGGGGRVEVGAARDRHAGPAGDCAGHTARQGCIFQAIIIQGGKANHQWRDLHFFIFESRTGEGEKL